jgi:hypothetical protein
MARSTARLRVSFGRKSTSLRFAFFILRMRTYADVCWRMLAYAGVLWPQIDISQTADSIRQHTTLKLTYVSIRQHSTSRRRLTAR